jgi:hypothetical protein
MSDLSRAQRGAQVNGEGQSPLHIRPLPRISLQAFCETPEFASSVQAAAADRRMSKVHVKVQMGGAPAAVEAYAEASTPNVIAIESIGNREALLENLDRLAGVCDPDTKVVVVGHVNDVLLYRELMRRGVSEYLIAPVKRCLIAADEILLVAEPDLANLRNAKSLYEWLKAARPNDAPPRLVLNKTGVPKRPEIGVADFAEKVGAEATVIPYDAQLFGSAANNGRMISEIQGSGKHAEVYLSLARALTGRTEMRKPKFNLPFQLPFMKRTASRKM